MAAFAFPPDRNVTTSQVNETAVFGQNQNVTKDADVTDWNRQKPAPSNGCDG